MNLINSGDDKAAGLPLSEAIVSNGFVFVSGQVAIDKQTGKARPGDIKEETELILMNLKRILQAAGSDLHHVIRCGVYLRDLKDFQNMNEAYRQVFGEHKPTRTTIQAVLIEPFKIEIDAVAELPKDQHVA